MGLVTTGQKNNTYNGYSVKTNTGTAPIANKANTSGPYPQTTSTGTTSGTSTGTTQQKSVMGSPTQLPQNKAVSYDENGNAAVRQSLNNRGVPDDMIGWDDTNKSVTIGGQTGLYPSSVKDGTSYADSSTINRLTNQAYAQMGDPVVSASQAAAASGFGNAVKWDNETGTVSVGGTVINPLYVSDGIAYVRQSDINNAIANMRSESGVQTPQNIYDAWNNVYGSNIDKASKAVDNFHYDPATDKEYQAYANYQMQQAQKLAQDAAARAADASGAYGGANIAAATGSLYDASQNIASQIPTYAQQAYSRLQNSLENAQNIGNDQYTKQKDANTDAYNRYQYGLDTDYQRYKDERDWALQAETQRLQNEYQQYLNRMSSIDADRYNSRADMADKKSEQELWGAQLDNEAKFNEGTTTMATMGGNWSDEAARRTGYTTPDGTFISYYDMTNGNMPSPMDYYYNMAYYPQKGTNDANLAYWMAQQNYLLGQQ